MSASWCSCNFRYSTCDWFGTNGNTGCSSVGLLSALERVLPRGMALKLATSSLLNRSSRAGSVYIGTHLLQAGHCACNYHS
jgi:hypothetical protein